MAERTRWGHHAVEAGLLLLLTACSGGSPDPQAAATPGSAPGSASPTGIAATAAASPATARSVPSPRPSSRPSPRTTSSHAPVSPAPLQATSPRSAPRSSPASSPRPTPSRRPSPPPPSPTRSAATVEQLTIQDFAFDPRTMTIPVGTTVRVTNRDAASHTWTSDTGVWDSGDLDQGEAYSFTFRSAGTFTFHCSPHPSMTGSIVVR